YRSGQAILDGSYRLIGHNNPDRLEVKLGITKKLAGTRRKGEAPQVLAAETAEEEAEQVLAKILQLRADDSQLVWKDFAILARANNHLDPFVAALKRRQIPYQRIGNRGLFDQPEVRDLIALLKVVANPADSLALYRVLGFSSLDISGPVVISLLNAARTRQKTLWDEVRVRVVEEAGFGKLVSLVERVQNKLVDAAPSQLLHDLVSELSYLKKYLAEDSLENQLKINNLDLFLGVIKRFETESPHRTVRGAAPGGSLLEFLDYLDLLIEAGENPAQAEIEDIDTVNLLTAHRAKGLEFPIVFLVGLVSDRFPTRRRRDPIPLPDDLVKETLPEGDSHLQGERRLFYVGCTRARDRLFLTWARKYGGGIREKRPSGFIAELGPEVKSHPASSIRSGAGQMSDVKSPLREQMSEVKSPPVRKLDHVSYSQLDTFSVCPLRYKYRYVLRIPVPTSPALSFGKTIHETLRLFHQKKDLAGIAVSRDDLLSIYDQVWIDEGYTTVEHKEQRRSSGRKLLKDYYEKHSELLGRPAYLEKKFRLRVGGIPLIGFIDRIDRTPDGGFEIIDYKTGSVKDQRAVDRDEQLSVYALAAREVLGTEPQVLSLYFFEQNQKVSTKRDSDYLKKKKQEIARRICQIESDPLEPKVGRWCEWCDYKKLCPAYRIE
ncbi:ATP-dependent helicase, partial [Candidatus Parcubacteria bacterium]|nr:ATP-dependent helicase [Candidatus Parcubacteria bacterium]